MRKSESVELAAETTRKPASAADGASARSDTDTSGRSDKSGRPRTSSHWRTPAGRAAKTMLRSLALLLLALGVFEILRITLIPTPGSVAYSEPDLHPFATIRLYLRDGTIEEQVFQIGGNIAMGFLLGFLLPQITPYLRGLIRVEAATAVLIAGVEAVQHFFIPGTSVNVDDLILAGIGAALGYLPLGRMFGMRLHPHHLHWWQQILARVVRRRRGARSA